MPCAARRIPVSREFADGLVVFGHGAFALQDMNLHAGLEGGGGGEDLGVAHRRVSISLDEPGGNTAHCLNGQGERGDIQQQDLTLERRESA